MSGARLWLHFPSVAILQVSLLHHLWMQQIWAPESGPKSSHSKPEAKSPEFPSRAKPPSLATSSGLFHTLHCWDWEPPRPQSKDQLPSSAPPLEGNSPLTPESIPNSGLRPCLLPNLCHSSPWVSPPAAPSLFPHRLQDSSCPDCSSKPVTFLDDCYVQATEHL